MGKRTKTKLDKSFFYPLSAKRYPLAIFLITPFLCGFQFYSALKNEEGNRLYGKGQVGKARSAYERALKSEPNSPEIAFNLGNAYHKEESFDKSLGAYKKAAEDKKSPLLQSKAFYNLGNSLFRRKETDKAVEFYKQALRLNPKDEDAKYNLEFLSQRENQQQNQRQNQRQEQPQDKQDPKQNQDGGQKTEDRGQKTEDRGQKTEDGGQKTEDRGQKTEGREQKTEGGEQKTEDGGQRTEDGEQKTEGREQKTEKEEIQKPKTQAQIRAEQILNALENEEKQILRMEGGQKTPSRKTQYLVDKDW